MGDEQDQLAMPSSRATVAAGFVTGMLAGALRRGLDPQPWLEASGIPEAILGDESLRVPVARYARLYNTLNLALDDEAFGLFALPLRVGSFELLCRGLVSATNLAEALERASRYLRVLLPDIRVDLVRERDQGRLLLRETRPLAESLNDPGRVFAFEWLLRLLHGLSCWLVGRSVPLEEVAFPYDQPPHVGDYALIYTARSRFGAACLEARFQANLLDLPLRRDETALLNFLEGAPGKLTTLYRRDRQMVLRVRDALRDALPQVLELDVVAGLIHLSPRTLERRLTQEGSSFRAIKDALRRDMALSRLVKTDHSVARIAADLGYADPSALYRACVDWTGKAPAEYRREARGVAVTGFA